MPHCFTVHTRVRVHFLSKEALKFLHSRKYLEKEHPLQHHPNEGKPFTGRGRTPTHTHREETPIAPQLVTNRASLSLTKIIGLRVGIHLSLQALGEGFQF